MCDKTLVRSQWDESYFREAIFRIQKWIKIVERHKPHKNKHTKLTQVARSLYLSGTNEFLSLLVLRLGRVYLQPVGRSFNSQWPKWVPATLVFERASRWKKMLKPYHTTKYQTLSEIVSHILSTLPLLQAVSELSLAKLACSMIFRCVKKTRIVYLSQADD